MIEGLDRSRKKNISWAVYLLVFLAVLFAMETVDMFFYSPIAVDGRSMVPTLQHGDVLIISKTKEPEINDIIVLNVETDSGTEPFIKRLIAFGGDTVWCEEGVLYREHGEGEGRTVDVLEQSYLTEENAKYTDFDKVNVPKGEVFFLGDNRKLSNDSRYEEIGTVSENNILGVVTEWSLENKGTLTAILGWAV